MPPYLESAIRAVFTLLLVYLFLAMLMTASGQQSIITQLNLIQGGDRLSYSAALARVNDIAQNRVEVAALNQQLNVVTNNLRKTSNDVLEAVQKRDAAWDQFSSLASEIQKSGACEMPPGAQPLTQWNRIIQCAKEDDLPARLETAVNAIRAAPDGYADAYNAWYGLQIAASNLAADSQRIQTKVDQLSASTNADTRLDTIFKDLSVLRSSWVLGGSVLLSFPPSMLQILLSFFSGAFGAILVTLILIVYPNDSAVEAATREYFSRVLLGGLIAVCVYVVLAGGSSILGGDSEFEGGSANFMTFCAVCILAGMFSDRVAAWLSERANTFFSAAKAKAATP